MRQLIFGMALVCQTAFAVAQDPAANLSLLAGYKATFTCSGVFNTGRDIESLAANEFTGIYTDYREAFSSLPDAVIDRENKTVSVTYAKDSPPRVAAWRPYLGCAQLPTRGEATSVSALPKVALSTERTPSPLTVRLSNDENLLKLVDAAFVPENYGGKTSAVLIVHKGNIVAEKYAEGFGPRTAQRTWSVAKSIAATIIGAAVHQGIIDVQDPTGLSVWSNANDPRSEVTLDDLLRMSSGLTSGTAGNRTDDVYFGGGRVIDHAVTNRLVREPGSHWRYANNDTMTAVRTLREKMNDDKAFHEFPFKTLINPLGMADTHLETDWNGDFILSSQVWTTSRDLARLGLLYLNDGILDGNRILPKDWIAYVSSSAGPQPESVGYGAQFWLYGEKHELPDGVYAARGNRGQYLFIVPSEDLLVIRRGYDSSDRFDPVKFTRYVIAVLP
ncbi:MAG: serine hydrolase [Pseudomonadota bacterium]